MKVAMIGTGYVGLVTGTCFSESGNDVTCVDVDQDKIERLAAGNVPIYEPGLTELVTRNVEGGRLHFTTSYEEAIPEARCVFVAVGTPSQHDGAADLSALWKVADTLAPLLREDAVVVVKSTVPVGTNARFAERLREKAGREVDTASNPEFLKEGAAVQDFTKPDRVVVGVRRPEVAEPLRILHEPFLRTRQPFLVMSPESAEMTKYVANCMLATKISFINEMANLCERVGADVNHVREGIGHDQRIGFQFLFPGAGYGGSCFPKDVRALIHVAQQHGMTTRILESVEETNNAQKETLFRKINDHFGGELEGRTIAVWGLSFKPRTDDVREAPSLVLVSELLRAGARVNVHDPVAHGTFHTAFVEQFGEELAEGITFCDHHYHALHEADALAICTEWKQFSNPDFDFLKVELKQPLIFDGRNLYDPQRLAADGFHYFGIGLHGEPARAEDGG